MDGTPSKFILYRHLTASGLEYRWRLRDAKGRALARSVAANPDNKAGCEEAR
jgi:hypothetical protein